MTIVINKTTCGLEVNDKCNLGFFVVDDKIIENFIERQM